MSAPAPVTDPQRSPTITGSALLAGPTAKAAAIAGSDMAAAISGFDWACTPLGPAEQWPQSLKSAVRLMLGSRYPMFIWWGRDLTAFYNDAYVDILGPRHPQALGRSARQTWAEIWDVVGPQAAAVTQDGASTWNDRLLLVMERNGYTQETYFTFSCSPCFDDQGDVGGVFCTCTEDTRQVLGERRLKTLGALSAAVLESHNAQQACRSAAGALAGNAHDLPFALFYLQDDAQSARLVAATGVEHPALAVPRVSLHDPGADWPLALAARSREPQLVTGLALRAAVPAGPWPEAVEEALVLPLPSPAPGAPCGFLVTGLNPRRPLDADYREWLSLVAQQVASAIADAHSFEEEQRRAAGEQALRAEVEQVLESIAEGFAAVDRDWRFTYVNRTAEAIYERTREDLLGRSLWDCFPEVAHSAFGDAFQRAMRERTVVTVEGPYDPLAGWFEVSIYPVASGGVSYTFRNVLHTRLLQQSIRDSEAQQRFLSEFGALMQRIEDPEQVLNEAVAAIAGHLQADRCIWSLVEPDEDDVDIRGEFRRADMPSLLGRMRLSELGGDHQKLYRNGLPFVSADVSQDRRAGVEWQRYARAGIAATISCGLLRHGRLVAGIGVHQATPRHWSESEVALVQAAAQRCWEAFERAQVQRRQREDAEALAQALAALQQVERRKDQFIATLAHELRNPLAPLRNGVQLLSLGGGPDGGARVLAMMRRQIDHLVRLVDDLLEVSRITSGKVVLQRARVPLHEVLVGAAESSRPVIEAARHSLHVDVDGVAGALVDGDPMRLAQVFTNLLNNAAKYTEPGGHIALNAALHDDQVVVEVQDDGMGLEPQMLEEVFQPFVQADRSAARAQGGLGIGLSIVRSLAELHGGAARARSAGLGCGATFEIRLPVADAPVPPQQSPDPGSAASLLPAGDGPSVLVVDDNRDAADSLAAMLEMMGAHTRVVYGGPDALNAIEAELPALVLLDIGMPGMDGYEVMRRIGGHPGRARMHVVALTGWGQSEDRLRTQQAGFDEHLVKPAEIAALEQLLARVAVPV